MSTYPPSVISDARNRAWRTLVQGLLIDVGAAVVAALVVALSGQIEWTQTYWVGVLVLLGKTAVHAATSYVARKVAPPR